MNTIMCAKNLKGIAKSIRLIRTKENEMDAMLDLEKEFRAWEKLSDEAFMLMEKRLSSKL